MKKKFLLGGALALFVTITAYAANCYTCIQDDCGKCYINCDGSKRSCGKCGGYLEAQKTTYIDGADCAKGPCVQAWFKCTKCGHQSKWKW